MLAFRIVQDWCSQEAYLKDVKILIFLRLQQVGNVKSIYTAIKRCLLPTDSRLNERDIENLIKCSSSVMIILDGFDDYFKKGNGINLDIKRIIKKQMFLNFEILLTTRFLPKEMARETVRLRITGLDDRMRDNYLRTAVVGEDGGAIKRIKRRLNDNPVLEDLCQVTLFFVILAHISHDRVFHPPCKTTTALFRYMMDCLQIHPKSNIMTERDNVETYHLYGKDYIKLYKLAFEGLKGGKEKLVWRKHELAAEIGDKLYDMCLQTGVLIEEEILDSSSKSDLPLFCQFHTEVRFFHIRFCEWYAAHYVAKYVESSSDVEAVRNIIGNIDPVEHQYFYRFACGLNTNIASSIIKVVKTLKGGGMCIVLCLFELTDKAENFLHGVRDMFLRCIELKKGQNKLQQKAVLQVLSMASRIKIPIYRVDVVNCFHSVDVSKGYLYLNSNMSMSVLPTLRNLWIWEEITGREMTNEEITDVIKYASLHSSLEFLGFGFCLLPQLIDANVLSDLRSRNVEVLWGFPADYSLNLLSGQWQSKGEVVTNQMYQRVVTFCSTIKCYVTFVRGQKQLN
ncbi:hypothetical protein HOLleu_01973 [Holothuria leucospilota]|uniref:NACHT domain-containing protein n=1 Tax=Holothuria leucospilota TaxID=206669 RepID=A0A9Q1HL39_HOLLE|nr:hypothetical protein HOLleu_01973 [Holothuria leucospilota]